MSTGELIQCIYLRKTTKVLRNECVIPDISLTPHQLPKNRTPKDSDGTVTPILDLTPSTRSARVKTLKRKNKDTCIVRRVRIITILKFCEIEGQWSNVKSIFEKRNNKLYLCTSDVILGNLPVNTIKKSSFSVKMIHFNLTPGLLVNYQKI